MNKISDVVAGIAIAVALFALLSLVAMLAMFWYQTINCGLDLVCP